ncbi:MAG: methionyl-tRNA formyltransferase, partial [Clostridia bacterium]|nr:methionyl-tRNA formyltransferase [Clostridia bacterium]
MRILFMGTPEIAATCLKRLIDDGKNLVGVVTREDKPRGRGNVMTPTPVKSLALENNIPVYTPKTLRDEGFTDILRECAPELIVVVAYGKILPKEVLNFPAEGCINLHVSLLPKYRGAAPMQRAIMEGESETGVTVMYMDEGLDTGDILAQVAFPISESDDFEAIHDRSADIGSRLLSETVDNIANGNVKREKQDSSLATYA